MIDIASRRVVGYALAAHLRTELVGCAGQRCRSPRSGPGRDLPRRQGLPNTSAEFATLARDYAVMLSHGRTGQCWDNALAESFFASIKGELLDLQAWPTRPMAKRAIVEYIGWYNGTRLHSILGYRSPAEYEEASKVKKVA